MWLVMRLGSGIDSHLKIRRTRKTLQWKQEGSSPLRKDSKCRFMKEWITNSNSIAGGDWEWWRPGRQTLSLSKVQTKGRQLFWAGRLSRGLGDRRVSHALSQESVWWRRKSCCSYSNKDDALEGMVTRWLCGASEASLGLMIWESSFDEIIW